MEEIEAKENADCKPDRKKIIGKMRENPWILSTVVLGVLFLGLLFGGIGFNGSVTGAVSASVAADNFQKFADAKGIDLTINDVFEKDGLYMISFSTEEGDSYVYVSKDGKNLVSGLVSLDLSSPISETTEIPKADKPVVELFVMSYCPYGMKAQEILFPVMKLLGDKVDFRVRFVYYAMHGKKEIDENFVQYCIQEEEPEKYADYLACFLESEDSDSCINSVGISKSATDECISAVDNEFKITERYNDESTWLSGRYPLFDIEKDIGDSYGIGGSEALVINGVTASMSDYRWSSEKLKDLICNSFNDMPEECSQTLDSGTESSVSGSCE